MDSPKSKKNLGIFHSPQDHGYAAAFQLLTQVSENKNANSAGYKCNGDLLRAGPLNSCSVARRGFNKAVTSSGHEMKFWVVLYE
jgi:hypothetical protein